MVTQLILSASFLTDCMVNLNVCTGKFNFAVVIRMHFEGEKNAAACIAMFGIIYIMHVFQRRDHRCEQAH